MSKRSNRNMPKRSGGAPWPLLLALGGVLLVGIAVLVAWRGSAAPKAAIEVSGAPKLKVNQEKVDLGNVPLGQTVRVSFEITNAGDRPLMFDAVPYVEVVEGC
ncbi:MAG: hypothetical protein HY260_12360 [Chloroflexi bacterium]|nr:hypothetical protein [Chloroflexota bacterium]